MLHVFHVDGGRTYHVEVGSVTGSVGSLQKEVASATRVAVEDQVLLVSGGAVLDGAKPLAHYSGAGTDGNPVFLASRVVNLEPGALPFSGDEAAELRAALRELEAQLDSVSPSPTFESVKRLSGLAKSAGTNAERALQVSARLVHEQHFLHQGWSTLVANLSDVVASNEKRMQKLAESLARFGAQREKAAELLGAFGEDLGLLQRIPVPESLLSGDARSQLNLAASALGTSPDASVALPRNLLEWINAADPKHSLKDLANEARSHLEALGRFDMASLAERWHKAKTEASKEEMTQIKGIGKRLSQLDEYLNKAEAVGAEQRKWAESVVGMEGRALPRPGPQVLADVRTAQADSLKGMLAQQAQLVEIAEKFRDSKAELLDNVRRRIGTWITETHGAVHDVMTRQMRQASKLTLVRKRLDVVKQIHEAPMIFSLACAEVLRRRSFAADFAHWSAQLARQASTLRESESEIRSGARRKLEKHFLRALFPGLAAPSDLPHFATQAPPPFDTNLPNLQVDDLQMVREATPELKPYFQVSKSNVYERLSVEDPKPAHSSLRREPSFLSAGTPPRGLLASKSFPSSTWLSGDENLGGLEPSPSTQALMAPALGKPASESESESGAGAGIKLEPIGGEEEAGEDNGRSAPIPISRPPSMAASHHASAFGTPNEEFQAASSGELGQSLPEMISKSELIGSLNKDIGRVASPAVVRPNSLTVSTPSPSRKAMLKDTDPLADTTTLLLTASRGTAETQTSQEMTPATEVKEKEAEIERLQGLQEAAMQTSRLVGEKGGALGKEVTELRCELADVQKEIQSLVEEQAGGVGELRAKLEGAAQALQAQLQSSQDAALHLQQQEASARLAELEGAKAKAEETVASLEAVAQVQAETAEQKELEIAALKTSLAEAESIATSRLEEAKAEISKHLIIDNELAMEQLRKGLKAELAEKDGEMGRLSVEVEKLGKELEAVRKERETLLASAVEASSSPPAHSHLEGRLRAELEMEFRDKLSLLMAGADRKSGEVMERVEAEKRAELRILRDEKDQEIAALKAQLAVSASVMTEVPPPPLPEELGPVGDAGAGPSGAVDPMAASVMTLSVSPLAEEPREAAPKAGLAESGGGLSRETQTRLGLKDLALLLKVQDIGEGDTVLCQWSPSFKGFVLYTNSSTVYFVKESSSRRMELLKGDGSPAAHFALARLVKKPDYCQIKKLDNRYNLALDTKFYRVEVERVALPARGASRSANSASLPPLQETSRE